MCATHFALLQVFQGLEVAASLKSTGAKVLKNPLLKRGKTTAPDLARSKTETATKNRTTNPPTSISTNGGSKASPQVQSKSLRETRISLPQVDYRYSKFKRQLSNVFGAPSRLSNRFVIPTPRSKNDQQFEFGSDGNHNMQSNHTPIDN